VQPNAPGTQGYNRYAYAANNPTTWTDPSGHTIDDIQQGVKVITKIVDVIAILGTALVALLPIILLDPILGFAIGLVFYMAFFKLGMLLLQSIADVLALMTDQFDHYDGDAPEENATSGDESDELPKPPVNCGDTQEQIVRITVADGDVTHAEESTLRQCGVGNVSSLALYVDLVGLIVAMAAVGVALAFTFVGCLEGAGLGPEAILIGCAFGYANGQVAAKLGSVATIALLAAPFLVTCEATSYYSDDCWNSVKETLKGLAIPDPPLNAAWNFYAVCNDRGYDNVASCWGN
jgi:hypothetical protein